MSIEQAALDEFLGRFVSDLGATFHAANVVIGDKLGLYKALAAAGPSSSAELAERTATTERYVREWLRGQAAGGYVTYDADTDCYLLSEVQAFALAQEESPAFVPGAFQLAASTMKDEAKIAEAFRTGAGVGWHEHHRDLFEGTERFFRPGYNANLVDSWLPAPRASRPNWRRAPAWPTSAAGTGPRPSSWPRPTPTPPSLASTTTSPPSSGPEKRRQRRVSAAAARSRLPVPRTSPAPDMTSWHSSTASTTWATP